ncbi:MAG: hypothetical protein K2Q18_10775 [Bdellovibrionales bacterium]|nr:hypothetical protein [Bdellovibrionales bacterium]
MNQNSTKKPIPTLEDIILDKGDEWRATLDYARISLPHNLLTDRNLIRLTKGAATIAQTELMVKLLFQDSKERPVGVPAIDLFFKVVDHSNYSLSEWLQAVTFFQEWLEKEKRTTNFQKMLGYLQCCEDSPENKNIEYRFIDLVSDFLKNHGFVG